MADSVTVVTTSAQAATDMFKTGIGYIVSEALHGRFTNAWDYLSKLDPNQQFGSVIAISAIALFILAIAGAILFAFWHRWVRYWFQETYPVDEDSKNLTENQKKIKQIVEAEEMEEVAQEVLPEPETYTLIPIEDASVEDFLSPNGEFQPTAEMNERTLVNLVNIIREREKNFCLFKNRLFEKLMKFCENQLDIARSHLLIEVERKIASSHKGSSSDQAFQMFRIVSATARSTLLTQLRSFLRFDESFIRKSDEGQPIFDQSDVESRIRFLKSKYMDAFQTNPYHAAVISVADISDIVDSLDKPVFQNLVKEIFEFHEDTLKKLAERIKLDNDEVERLVLNFVDNEHR